MQEEETAGEMGAEEEVAANSSVPHRVPDQGRPETDAEAVAFETETAAAVLETGEAAVGEVARHESAAAAGTAVPVQASAHHLSNPRPMPTAATVTTTLLPSGAV